MTAAGKVAGLGAVEQIHVTLTGDAACINPGSNKPQAANKESFSASGDFPVQNGKALFSLDLTATFQPDCTPPMTVVWSNISITVTARESASRRRSGSPGGRGSEAPPGRGEPRVGKKAGLQAARRLTSSLSFDTVEEAAPAASRDAGYPDP